MSDWQHTLRLTPEWTKANDAELKLHALAAVVAKRLRKLKIHDEEFAGERDTIAEAFEEIAAEGDAADPVEFNYAMGELYDWADTPLDAKFGGKKLCWVKTF